MLLMTEFNWNFGSEDEIRGGEKLSFFEELIN